MPLTAHHQKQSKIIANHLDWQDLFGAQHYRCSNPEHKDEHASLFVYPDGMHCFGCGWRIYDIGEACRIFLGWNNAKTRRLLYNYLANHPPRAEKLEQLNPIPVRLINAWVDARCARDTKYLADKYSISSDVLDLALIGVVGDAFSIPHIGLDGNVWTVKFRRDDRKTTDGPKYWSYKGRGQHYLFPAFALWNYLKVQPPKRLLICESELDALSAMTHGYAALAVPSGANTNLDKWRGIWSQFVANNVTFYVAFDMDEAGQRAAASAQKYLSNFPGSLVIRLEWEGANDLADLFIRGGSPLGF